MSIIDLDKSSHQTFSDRYYRDNMAFRRDGIEAAKKRQRDFYLGLANDATAQGVEPNRADALRQVACGLLPREWADITKLK